MCTELSPEGAFNRVNMRGHSSFYSNSINSFILGYTANPSPATSICTCSLRSRQPMVLKLIDKKMLYLHYTLSI